MGILYDTLLTLVQLPELQNDGGIPSSCPYFIQFDTSVQLQDTLLDALFVGYRENTYCEDERRDAPHYRSEIPGINKIYLSHGMTDEDNDYNFIVEILSPIGEHLPRKIEIRGEICEVKFYKSDDYTSEVDY